MEKTKSIYATMWVGYWKEGDDLARHLDEKPVAALRAWADDLEESIKSIREVANILEGKDVEIDAGTHHIGISGLDNETFERLEKTGAVQKLDIDEDEDDLEGDLDDGDIESDDTGE